MQLTAHAELRSVTRNISLGDICTILKYGAYHNAPKGYKVRVQLKDLPFAERQRHPERCKRLTKIVVVIDRQERFIITAYYEHRKQHRPHSYPFAS